MSYSNSVADGDLKFGLSLMSHLGEGNISISPTSLRTALSMLYEGARGETAKQISDVAMLPENAPERHEGIKEMSEALNVTGVPYTIRCANGVWLAQEYPINPNFKDVLTGDYGAEARAVNFKGNADGERQGINKWVGDKTEQKILNLLPPGSINPDTITVLANALYFKAPWEKKFDPKYTQKQDYTLSSEEVVQVDMMRKGAIDKVRGEGLSKFSYGRFDGVQVVRLPYKGHGLSKLIMLPPKGNDVKGLEKYFLESSFDLGKLGSLLQEEEFAKLEIPKHEVRGTYDLGDPLSRMGINLVFSGAADLSGIGPGPLFVNKGVHQTYFKTNEEGSEGAAATAFATMRFCAMETKSPIEFIADRPFLEGIIDNRSGTLLFLNRIEDPR